MTGMALTPSAHEEARSGARFLRRLACLHAVGFGWHSRVAIAPSQTAHVLCLEFNPRHSRVGAPFWKRSALLRADFYPRHSRVGSACLQTPPLLCLEFNPRHSRVFVVGAVGSLQLCLEFNPRHSRVARSRSRSA